jgi:hypothetical protein
MLLAAALVGVIFHVLMDLPTSYGTRPLSPFSWRWYGLDWLPIIDIYLWIALGSGLFLGRLSLEARRRNATIVLTFVAAIYGVRAYMHHQAMDLAPRLFGAVLPPRCDAPPESDPMVDSWPKPVPSPAATGRRCLVEIAAIPTFMSPFDWRIVAQMSNSYEIHDVNILDGGFATPTATPCSGGRRSAIRTSGRPMCSGPPPPGSARCFSASRAFRRRAPHATPPGRRPCDSPTCASSAGRC